MSTLPLAIVVKLPYRSRYTDNAPLSTTDIAVGATGYATVPTIIRVGSRDNYFWGLSYYLAKRGIPKSKADIIARSHFERCDQPSGDKYSWALVEAKLERAFSHQGEPPKGHGENHVAGALHSDRTQQMSFVQAINNLVFIADGSQVADLSRSVHIPILSINDFRNSFANYPTKEKVTFANRWLRSTIRRTAVGNTYYPSLERIIILESADYYNFFVPTILKQRALTTDDVINLKLFYKHINYLFMDHGANAGHFIKWLAFTIQCPQIRIPWAPVLVSQFQGIGKGWLYRLLCLLLGHRNCFLVEPTALENGFNEWWGGTLMWLDELDPKRDFYERLKFLITEPYGLVNPKYGKKENRQIFCNVICTSNHINALKIDRHDRRFWVTHMTDPPKSAEYYITLFEWLEGPGPEALYNTLLKMDISGFNYAAPPANTTAKETMVDFATAEVEELITDAVAHRIDIFEYDLVPRDLIRAWAADKLQIQLNRSDMYMVTKTLNSICPHQTLQKVYTMTLPSQKRIITRPIIIRNHQKWCTALKDVVAKQLLQVYEGSLR